MHFQGQPILLIAAETEEAAEEASKYIKIEIEAFPVIVNPTEAFSKGHLLSPSRKFTKGNVADAFANCKYIFEGQNKNG